MSADRRQSALEVRIEELVLHGFAAHERFAIAGAVESELARMLGARGLSESLMQAGGAARLDGGSFDVGPRSGPATVGRKVAASLCRVLQR